MSNTVGELYRPWLQAEVTGTTANFAALTLPPCQLAGVTAVAGLLALLNFRCSAAALPAAGGCQERLV